MQLLRPQRTKAVAVADATCELAAKHQARQQAVLVLALSLLLRRKKLFKSSNTSHVHMHMIAHQRGVLISAAVDLARRRRRNFARQHNELQNDVRENGTLEARLRLADSSYRLAIIGIQPAWWLAGRGWTRSELQAAAPIGAAASAASSKV